MTDIKDLFIILVSSSLVSNVVLSQFLGLCPFLGVSKKTSTAAGMGTAVQRCIRSDLQIHTAAVSYRIFADYRIHSGDRSTGSVC